jgi:hypothetical protein
MKPKHKIEKKYRIAEMWKTGERLITYKRKKPQGYIIYENGLYKEFLAYENQAR